MRKSRKKHNKKNRIMFIIVLLLIITFVLLITQIIKLVKNTSNIKNNDNFSSVLGEEKQEEAQKEQLRFDSFVDNIYTEKEIENLNVEELNRLLKVKVDKLDGLDCKRVVGSAENVNGAKKIASDAFASQNQFIIAVNIIEENETFYVVNVKWRYVSENVNAVYEQNVIVFKKFYYDKDARILNLDEKDKIKFVLDLDNYVINYNNSNKKLIQSFIHKEGKRCEYILYYLDAKYNSNDNDTMNFVKEQIIINPETGVIEQDIKNNIKQNIVIE